MIPLLFNCNTLFVKSCDSISKSMLIIETPTNDFDITYFENLRCLILSALAIVANAIVLWYVVKRFFDSKKAKRVRKGEERERLFDLKKFYQGKLLASLEGDKSDDAKAQYRDRLNGFLEETNRELEKLDTNK